MLASIPSIPHIEALMLLRATAPQRWAPESLAQRLYVTTEAATAVVADLAEAGMLHVEQQEASCHYAPGTRPLADVIDRLAECYATQLVEITLLIHSRLDSKALQFATAFSWRTPR